MYKTNFEQYKKSYDFESIKIIISIYLSKWSKSMLRLLHNVTQTRCIATEIKFLWHNICPVLAGSYKNKLNDVIV